MAVVGEDREGLGIAGRHEGRRELERRPGGDQVDVGRTEDDLDVPLAGGLDDFPEPGGDDAQVGGAEHEALGGALGGLSYLLAQDARVRLQGLPLALACQLGEVFQSIVGDVEVGALGEIGELSA